MSSVKGYDIQKKIKIGRITESNKTISIDIQQITSICLSRKDTFGMGNDEIYTLYLE